MEQLCTLADSTYGPQVLAQYRSLETHMQRDWHLTVLALDDEFATALRKLALPRCTVWDMEDAISVDPTISTMRSDRSYEAWCWSLAAQLTNRVFAETKEPTTYLDADVWWLHRTEPFFAEADQGEVAIHDHRFPPQYADRYARGRFNVGIVRFAPSRGGFRAAAWWAARVLDGCDRHMPAITCELPNSQRWTLPEGTAGDQGWLQAFPLFADTRVIGHPGSGLAPYNIMNWMLEAQETPDGTITMVGAVEERPQGELIEEIESWWPVLNYHYHEWRFERDGRLKRRTSYPLRTEDIVLLAEPYEEAVKAAAKEL